jgi:hypothetical protein
LDPLVSSSCKSEEDNKSNLCIIHHIQLWFPIFFAVVYFPDQICWKFKVKLGIYARWRAFQGYFAKTTYMCTIEGKIEA